jgi:bacillithiol biosynthesis cysteine-adding enzyme BshC
VNVEHLLLARTNALTQLYTERDPVVSAWFDGHADEPGADEARVAALAATAHLRADRDALCDVLQAYNARFSAPEAVQASIAALRDADTVAVVGGQQPGLLSGELLVMAKAIHVIQAARAAEQRLGRRVVPVFWVAGEDHDWEEVDHLYIGRGGQAPTKVKLTDARRSRLPLSAIALTAAQQDSVLSQLNGALPDSLHKREVMAMVQDSLVAGESITDAFARVMMHLFGEHGLILIDAADPGLRKLELPFMQTLLTHTHELHSNFQQRRDALTYAGFPPQVDLPDGQANVFVVHDGERMLLDHDAATGGYVDRKRRYRFSAEELRAKWAAEPTSFSTNVVTRPLMLEHLFPVLRTVVGAAELAYWALLQPAFHALGMSVPLVVPRTEWTVAEPAAVKALAHGGLGIADALAPGAIVAARDNWLAAQPDAALAPKFADATRAVLDAHARLLEQLGPLPGLEQVGGANAAKITAQLAYLQRRAELALEQRHAVELQRWAVAQHALRPFDKPQERVYNILDYLTKYGCDFVDRWLAVADDDHIHHHILYV